MKRTYGIMETLPYTEEKYTCPHCHFQVELSTDDMDTHAVVGGRYYHFFCIRNTLRRMQVFPLALNPKDEFINQCYSLRDQSGKYESKYSLDFADNMALAKSRRDRQILEEKQNLMPHQPNVEIVTEEPKLKEEDEGEETPKLYWRLLQRANLLAHS